VEAPLVPALGAVQVLREAAVQAKLLTRVVRLVWRAAEETERPVLAVDPRSTQIAEPEVKQGGLAGHQVREARREWAVLAASQTLAGHREREVRAVRAALVGAVPASRPQIGVRAWK
jgi:hypothetical protein